MRPWAPLTERSSFIFSRRIALVVAAAFFMETLDASIITTALPAISQSFHRPALSLTLGVSLYLLALAVFVPTAGWASERFGARNVFVGAIAVFTASSLACGLAPSPWTFFAARTVQGAAAAFMSPVGRLVVLRETPKQYLIEAIGLITWPALIAPVVGPPLAGFLTTYASWRWIFFLNVPLGLAGIALVARLLPRHEAHKHQRFDSVGFLLTAVALAFLVQGLSLIGERSDAAAGVGLLAAGVVSSFIAVRHARVQAAPLLDLRAAAVPTFAISQISAGLVTRAAISATPFLLPLLFEIGFGMNALAAGSMLLVYMLGNLVMKSATTRTLRRFGFARVLTANGALCAAAIGACGLIAPEDARALIYFVLLVAGMTRSMNFTTVNTLAFIDIAPAERAGSSALAAMAQQLGSALGVAFAALALTLSLRVRGASELQLVDFHHALWATAALMAAGTLWGLRLPRDAGSQASQPL